MKYIAPFCLLILFGCVSESPFVTLSNSSDQQLLNKPVTIARSNFNTKADQFLILKTENGEAIPVQHDDLDGDGQWDELSLLINFQPKEEVKLEYVLVTQNDLPQFPDRTSAHLGHSPERNKAFTPTSKHTRPSDHTAQSTPFLYQYEGPGWESELVAFRAYFDSRNGKDIFGKTKPQLISHQIGTEGNYHQLQDWGMDVLKVGSSLGAGALAILKNDSIYRITGEKKASFEKLTSGPIRSVVRLSYEDLTIGDVSYDLEETISIWAGKRHYESSVNLSSENKADTVVTGIVNLKGLDSKMIDTENAQILYTHGKQSENKDIMGMGIIVPRDGCFGFGDAPKEGSGVTNTYTALLKSNKGAYRYAYYVGWELENPQFSNKEFFTEQLKNTTTSFNNVIEIKTSK